MLFSGIPFLYCFLPVVMLLYFLVPRGWKNAVLLLFSLIFYAWGEPGYVLLMLAAIVTFYLCGLAIGRGKTRGEKRFFLILSIVLGLGALGVFKYADFLLGSVNTVTGLSLPLPGLALPIGISFYTFQCISYTVDVYRGRTEPQRNLISFGAYVSLFPQLIAGPIVRYTQVARELEQREHRWEDFALGLRRFLFGLGKKVLLANQFGALTEAFRDSVEKSVLFCWLYARQHNGILAALAHDIGGLVPGLCVYPPGREPGGQTAVGVQHSDCLDAHGPLAWSQLEFCAVGIGLRTDAAAGKMDSGAEKAAPGAGPGICAAGGAH